MVFFYFILYLQATTTYYSMQYALCKYVFRFSVSLKILFDWKEKYICKEWEVSSKRKTQSFRYSHFITNLSVSIYKIYCFAVFFYIVKSLDRWLHSTSIWCQIFCFMVIPKSKSMQANKYTYTRDLICLSL